jgi:hypothetical protein
MSLFSLFPSFSQAFSVQILENFCFSGHFFMRRTIERARESRPINWITPKRLGDEWPDQRGEPDGVTVKRATTDQQNQDKYSQNEPRDRRADASC